MKNTREALTVPLVPITVSIVEDVTQYSGRT
jgi:hypothetical protein